MPAEGFKGHVSLPLTAPCWERLESGERVVGQWYSCTLMKRRSPLRGMYGSVEVEYEVQRTIKRVELTAVLCLFRKVCGPIKVHVDNKGIIDGLRMQLRKNKRGALIHPSLGSARVNLMLMSFSQNHVHYRGEGDVAVTGAM